MNFFLVLQLISNPEVHNYMEDCHRKHNSVQLLGLSIEQTTPEWNPVFAVHFPSGWGRHSFMPQLSLLPYGPALTRWASPDRHHLGWSFIQRILSCLWDSKTKLMSVGAADAELPLQAKPMPAFCEGWGVGQALAVPWWDNAKHKLLGIIGRRGGKESFVFLTPDGWNSE